MNPFFEKHRVDGFETKTVTVFINEKGKSKSIQTTLLLFDEKKE